MTMTSDRIEAVLELPRGVRLRYARQGPRTSTAVVLIHGWPDSWRSFERVMDSMPEDLPVVAPSLRGFGGSQVTDSDFGLGDLAADVIDFIDGLGLNSVLLVGHSMGTMVAQRIAVERPDLSAGLVLVGGLCRLPDQVADELGSVVAELDDPIDAGFVREFQASTLAAPVPAEFFDRLVTESLKAPARVWRSAFAGMGAGNNVGELHRIAAPTLLIWGDHDGLVPRSEQELLRTNLPDARLTIYTAAGHSPNWEQPQRVAADIEMFARQTMALAPGTPT